MGMANEINSSLEQDEDEQDNHFQYSAILYKIKQLKSIMLLKKGERFFPLPMEELPSVFPYDIEPYRIVQLLNPFQFKVTRLDNSKLQVNSEVRDFFSNNLGHFFRYYPFLQDAFGKINMDFSPVNDGREIIVTIHFTPLVSLNDQRDQSNKKHSKLNSL